MRLSPDYHRVVAVFDTPLEEGIEYEKSYNNYPDSEVRSEFKVGPFLYAVAFQPDPYTVDVRFDLIDIEATDEELVQIISKAEGRPVSLQEAGKIKHGMLDNRSHEILGIGGSYAIRVFGSALKIIQDYVKRRKPRCIQFTSASQKRTDLYTRMMRQAFPKADIGLTPSKKYEIAPGQWDNATDFRVCFRR